MHNIANGVDVALKEYATERQCAYIDFINEHKNVTKAAKHFGVKENPLMIVEQHRTLAANDAYAARGGYISGRDAKVISYHSEHGEVSRLTINSDMLGA